MKQIRKCHIYILYGYGHSPCQAKYNAGRVSCCASHTYPWAWLRSKAAKQLALRCTSLTSLSMCQPTAAGDSCAASAVVAQATELEDARQSSINSRSVSCKGPEYSPAIASQVVSLPSDNLSSAAKRCMCNSVCACEEHSRNSRHSGCDGCMKMSGELKAWLQLWSKPQMIFWRWALSQHRMACACGAFVLFGHSRKWSISLDMSWPKASTAFGIQDAQPGVTSRSSRNSTGFGEKEVLG